MRRRRAYRISSSTVGFEAGERQARDRDNYSASHGGQRPGARRARVHARPSSIGGDFANTRPIATRLNCHLAKHRAPPTLLGLEDGRTVSTRASSSHGCAIPSFRRSPELTTSRGPRGSPTGLSTSRLGAAGRDVVLVGGGNIGGTGSGLPLRSRCPRAVLFGFEPVPEQSRYLVGRIAGHPNIGPPVTELTATPGERPGSWKRSGGITSKRSRDEAKRPSRLPLRGADPETGELRGCEVAMMGRVS